MGSWEGCLAMILSVSRRTDIPAFYMPWLLNRFEQGEVLVRNPFQYHRVSRIELSPQTVSFIAFWTKDAAPAIPWLNALNGYDYGFQYTITGYGEALEPGVPGLGVSLDTFRLLSDRIGPDRMVWRYDPILFHPRLTLQDHQSLFARIACALAGSTRRCIVSLLDPYPGIRGALGKAGIVPPTVAQMAELAPFLVETADRCGMTVEACAEPADFSKYGILPGHCLSPAFTGVMADGKDKGQRPHCGCQPSVDIGAYHSCPHQCVYCYANHGTKRMASAIAGHDPKSPLLLGSLEPEDEIRTRNAK
jgi:hypothetical protein